MNRMFCYLWFEKDKPDECKFGEKWVKAGEDPLKMIWERINNSVGVRKDLVRDGTIQLATYWDVSEYAKKVGRFYKHGKVDDRIRPYIGFRKGSTGEVHELSAKEVEIKVNKLLAKMGQPLPVAGLAAWQANTVKNVSNSVASNKRTIAAELCARFGKTIWSGALARELDAPITIVVSYVLTSFTSFEKDLTSFEQFKDVVIIDSANKDYQDIITAALEVDKQVVVFLSMCPGTKRQDKIDFLFSLPYERLVVVDEADFGVHKGNHAKPLIAARKEDDVVVLMTGTNADKAASYWAVNSYISVVYPELIMEKHNPQQVYNIPLKHFVVDPKRHELVVDVEFYQMDLKRAVEFARQSDPELFVENGAFLPSWSKTRANPVKAKGFLTRMFEAVFLGQHGWDELNVDYQTGRRSKEGQRVAMMFMPSSTTNECLEEIAAIAQQALPGYRVVTVYGGEDMTNRTAEPIAKEEIEKAAKANQHVLLLSAGMAQRSFSVGAITELYLAYDSGDNGATVQKISRALTPDDIGKIGRIVSLSFDPNRDDKFDSLLLETAMNYKRNHNIASAKEALRAVIKTVDIFRCTEEGALKIEVDEYLENAIERNSVSRVVGKVADLTPLSFNELKAIANGNIDYWRAAKQEAAQKGKTGLPGIGHNGSKRPTDDQASAKLIAKVREMITTVVENMDIIVHGTGTTILSDAFDNISNDPGKRQAVLEEFGLDFDLIRDLFDRNIINTDLIELQVDQ